MGRIDTHFHVVPPVYRTWLENQPSYAGPYVDWNEDKALEYLSANGIATGVLSISTPGVCLPAGDDRDDIRRLARAVNDFCAEIVRNDPSHFGFFATLTLPDLDGCLAEAQYALDDLNADGLVVMTNADGMYLGAPDWDPLLAMANERNAVVFVHPTAPVAPAIPGVRPGVVDFLADSVRSAVNLTKHHCLRRFPNLKVLLSHGGGYLPYAALRIAQRAFPSESEDDVLADLRRFYFDTALTAGPYTLPALLAFASAGQVTFGSDWPYASANQAAAFTEQLDIFPMTTDQSYAINRGNAERLFPRLRQYDGDRAGGQPNAGVRDP